MIGVSMSMSRSKELTFPRAQRFQLEPCTLFLQKSPTHLANPSNYVEQQLIWKSYCQLEVSPTNTLAVYASNGFVIVVFFADHK
jgi:hypothetical protein